MQFLVAFMAVTGLATAAFTNTTREFVLHTQVKKVTSASKKFNNLYPISYHTGAGLGDATLEPTNVQNAKVFINSTNHNLIFDLGNDFPWAMENVISDTFYSGWQPVRINAGNGGNSLFASGFFINSTGLQWSTTPKTPGGPGDSFGGWIACDWWHGEPQLFVRLEGYNTPAPSSCADINLIPKYL